jgi:hypothetical protein
MRICGDLCWRRIGISRSTLYLVFSEDELITLLSLAKKELITVMILLLATLCCFKLLLYISSVSLEDTSKNVTIGRFMLKDFWI